MSPTGQVRTKGLVGAVAVFALAGTLLTASGASATVYPPPFAVAEDVIPANLAGPLGLATSFNVIFTSDVGESGDPLDSLTATFPTVLAPLSVSAEPYGQVVEPGFRFNPNLNAVGLVQVNEVLGGTTSDYVASWNDGFGRWAVNFTSDSDPRPPDLPPPPVPEPSTILLISSGLVGFLLLRRSRPV